jgi:hypothetical protein
VISLEVYKLLEEKLGEQKEEKVAGAISLCLWKSASFYLMVEEERKPKPLSLI